MILFHLRRVVWDRLLYVGPGRAPRSYETIEAGADQPSAIPDPCDINHSITVTQKLQTYITQCHIYDMYALICGIRATRNEAAAR